MYIKTKIKQKYSERRNKMVRKKSVKRTMVAVPKSEQETSEFIRRIGKHQRGLDRIKIRTNNQIEKIKEKAVADSSDHEKEIAELFEGIFTFSQSHRDELTEKGKKKTVHFFTGDILWRLTPPAVSLKNVKKIIELCKTSGLKRFIRIKEDVNKEAMLKEPEKAKEIKGVTIGQKEEFVVKPSEIEIEIFRDTKKLQKALE